MNLSNVLRIIAIVVIGISLVLNIVGLTIPYWSFNNENAIATKIGLWEYCTCVDIGDAVNVTHALKATRAMEILGTLFIAAALLLAVCRIFMKDMWHHIDGGIAATAGLFCIIGCVIYAAKYKDDITAPVDLHIGFALCIIAGIGSIIAAVLLFVNRDSTEKEQ